jgi:hypothetical protein
MVESQFAPGDGFVGAIPSGVAGGTDEHADEIGGHGLDVGLGGHGLGGHSLFDHWLFDHSLFQLTPVDALFERHALRKIGARDDGRLTAAFRGAWYPRHTSYKVINLTCVNGLL